MSIKHFKSFAEKLAMESQKVILSYYDKPSLEVETKSNDTPVTRADRDGEEIMREMIAKEFPDHGIIGEEFPDLNTEAEYVWALDPIDGTITFTSGTPLFGTLICLSHHGEPILGVLNLPALNKLCIGDNETTTVNGKVVRMRPAPPLEKALLLTTDIENIAKFQDKERFETLVDKTGLMRTWGDCYGYYLLAGGWADIMLDPIMNPWDILALFPLIRGAGGIITDWQGNPAATGESCIAAQPELHEQVLKILNA